MKHGVECLAFERAPVQCLARGPLVCSRTGVKLFRSLLAIKQGRDESSRKFVTYRAGATGVNDRAAAHGATNRVSR